MMRQTGTGAELGAAGMCVDTVINALGGTSSVALSLGLSPGAISQWRLYGIPPRRWCPLEALARSLAVPGITVASLAALPPPAPRQAVAA